MRSVSVHKLSSVIKTVSQLQTGQLKEKKKIIWISGDDELIEKCWYKISDFGSIGRDTITAKNNVCLGSSYTVVVVV